MGKAVPDQLPILYWHLGGRNLFLVHTYLLAKLVVAPSKDKTTSRFHSTFADPTMKFFSIKSYFGINSQGIVITLLLKSITYFEE